MKKNKKNAGRIINVCGGGVGWRSDKVGHSAYVASKYALYGITEVMAQELSASDVVVTAVLPGPIDSQLREILIPDNTGHRSPELEKATDGIVWLAENADKKKHSGRLISLCWDEYKEIPDETDLYTIKRLDGRNYLIS